ncbi:hypothetical protein BZG02_15840 [Labilibaculum filiforme]|uniref:Uncharacterized protein n=1 Tax=Labilibaculum filiforme TaxID=1940526 RepID=A0A2N3HTQ1_9BACT|nr:DUF6515 family protein [Labilibaculum filiforme]PKQ61423.1 hypothetical protein BZG02_15840 [Labilibaculum filiforme]
MKKSVLYKLTASIVLVAAIAISTSSASAQRRSEQKEKTRYEERNKSTRLTDADRSEKYNKSSYSDRSNSQKKNTSNKQSDYYKRDRTSNKYSKNSNNGNSKHWDRSHNHTSPHKSYYSSGDRYMSYSYPKAVHSNKRYRNFYNQHGHNCYRHDRYGNVVLRFAAAPVVIRHTHGDYYFSDGDYYRFYPEVGYVMVDAPNSLYFSYVPDNCHRVSHRGNDYYTNGSIYFVKYRNGFRLVNTPGGIHLSLRF